MADTLRHAELSRVMLKDYCLCEKCYPDTAAKAMKLNRHFPNSPAAWPAIHVSELADGQLAIITEWHSAPSYIGTVVQRFGEALVNIGEPLANSWPQAFGSEPITQALYPRCMVRRLEYGELVRVCRDWVYGGAAIEK